jgi:hypothetical protein
MLPRSAAWILCVTPELGTPVLMLTARGEKWTACQPRPADDYLPSRQSARLVAHARDPATQPDADPQSGGAIASCGPWSQLHRHRTRMANDPLPSRFDLEMMQQQRRRHVARQPRARSSGAG